MTSKDHYYRSQLPNNNDSTFNINLHSHSSCSNNPNRSCTNAMGGQSPLFFTPSSYIIGGHKPASGQHLDRHSTMTLEAILNPRGPLQLVDFNEAIGGSGGEAGSSGDQQMMKRPSQLSYGGAGGDCDPGPGSAGSVGDPDMRMEYDQLEGGDYEGGVAGDLLKKGSRRLGYDQVKALEKAFEVENRLEPERKIRIASQLGLQPRQVAVWFQNRRARWKTKQMERDYSLLKNKFEALKADRDKLLQEKETLQAELAKFKGQPLVKQGAEREQGSPTMASGSLVDDAPASTVAPKMLQVMVGAAPVHHLEKNRMGEEEELLEEEASLEMAALHDQKQLLQTDSLSSTEDSDIQNDGAIEDSAAQAAILARSLHHEPDYSVHQPWRLPPAPTQLLYKPTTINIKNEEWPENGESMNSFNMPIDTWYNW